MTDSEAAEVIKIAKSLMGTCYSEANRIANHGANNWTEKNLYDAANEAKITLQKYP